MAHRSWTLLGIALIAAGCVLPSFKTDESLRDSGVAVGGSAGAAGGQAGGDAGGQAGSDASSEASAGAAGGPQNCPVRANEKPMIRLPANFCIDATEVSQEAYDKFLDAKLNPTSPDSQPQDICAWNLSFEPDYHWIAEAGPLEPAMPVVGVDWCDAWAYCKWNGKRLCGKQGGGTLAPEDVNNPSANEWTYACSSGGGTEFPYGATYDSSKCNTESQSIEESGTNLQCQASGAFCGVFDMSGNVWEWEDSCAPSANPPDQEYCNLRGGGFRFISQTPEEEYSCYKCSGALRSSSYDDIGFRCCADVE